MKYSTSHECVCSWVYLFTVVATMDCSRSNTQVLKWFGFSKQFHFPGMSQGPWEILFMDLMLVSRKVITKRCLDPPRGVKLMVRGAIKQPLRVKHHPLEGAGARFAVFLVSGRLVGFTTISDMHAALLNTSLSPLFFPSLKYHTCTLPETNIAPENRPLEKEIPMETTIFRGSVSFRECMSCLDGSTL